MGKSMKHVQLARKLLRKLDEDIIVHQYNAYGTNSVYLKFDYGVANSLRIGDHPGKKYLAYRFNLMTDQTKPHYKIMRNGFEMWFYPLSEVDLLVDAIHQSREERKARYFDYPATMQIAKSKADTSKGFWNGAFLVDRENGKMKTKKGAKNHENQSPVCCPQVGADFN